jgi:hypothetical protein
MPRSHNGDILNTYRYLRAAMIALLVMLLLAVGYQWWWVNDHACWLGSISAYYFTPARTVFIGSLFALGTCLIAYKGHSDAEDVLLNFSGFMAFVVAMVPTARDTRCTGLDYAPSSQQLADLVRNSVWSLIVVAVIAAGVRWYLRRDLAPEGMDRGGVIATVICGAVIVVELALFLTARASFISASHGIAAGTMVAGVIAVMVLSALKVEQRQEGHRADAGRIYRNWYIGIAIVLAVALALAVAASLVGAISDHLIIVAEVIIILSFIAYWIVQSHELWDLESTGDRTEGRAATRVTS